jgi:anhydro-N-acetylmuramic acid kinase
MKPASSLQRLASKDSFLCAGLMSGTSMDGVDAALVRMKADRDRPDIELIAFKTTPYPDELKDLLMDLAMGQACTAEDIGKIGTSVAIAFASAFFDIVKEGKVEAAQVDFIGSHGQTVAHTPPAENIEAGMAGMAGTVQLGPPGMIAALTGVTTIGDFRGADIALGGQGAPLAPYADYLLRRSRFKSRIILNIGGIANLTYLPEDCARGEVVAFDTGPGNMIIDSLFRAMYPGAGEYDYAGAKALKGRPNLDLVELFMSHPYFPRRPPKSAGHREFGAPFAWEFLSRGKARELKRDDILASAVSLTVKTIKKAIFDFITPLGPVDELFLTGGGSKNRMITGLLERELENIHIRTIAELGIPEEAKEAVDFALLARETLLGRVNVITSATGACQETILGTIALGSNL